jgi:hypothetical protein
MSHHRSTGRGTPISRRRVVTASAAGAAGAPPLPQPRVIRSDGGVLDITLTAQPAMVDMGAPQLVSTYIWDGVVPWR